MQDFPDGNTNSKDGREKIILAIFFNKTAWKIGPRGGGAHPCQPLGNANASILYCSNKEVETILDCFPNHGK